MFLGHFGVGLAAKRVAPRASLGTLFLASQFIDLLWPMLLLAGLERVRIAPGITAVTPLDFESYPISHSLAAVAVWGLALGAVYLAVRKDWRTSAVLAAAVVSHWVLDLVVHRPDLPLTPFGAERLGFGLWNSVPGTVFVEAVLLGAGVCLYTRTTQAKNAAGRFGFYGLVAFLALVYAANLLGPPPPSATAIAWAGQLQWLLVAWAYWTDGQRATKMSA